MAESISDGSGEGLEGYVLRVFSHLHEHPELSFKEWETTDFIAAELRSLGLSPDVRPGEPGVVAEWGSGPRTVGLRADMDALWQEVGGVWKANHSCGHDAHMTMVLGAARILREEGFQPEGGAVRLIFQPAEEVGQGARAMVARGAADGLDMLFGVHLRPIEELRKGFASAAIYNGASTRVQGEIRGMSAHAARPHLGANVIEAAATLVAALKGIWLNPMIPHSAKMTRLQAGGQSSNIIPDRAEFSLDLRAQTNEAMEDLRERVRRLAIAVEATHGVRVDMEFHEGTPAAVVSDEAKQVMRSAVSGVLGESGAAPDTVSPGAEDFHVYSVMRPDLRATMLGLGCDLSPGLHHPEMEFDRSVLPIGARILAEAVREALSVRH